MPHSTSDQETRMVEWNQRLASRISSYTERMSELRRKAKGQLHYEIEYDGFIARRTILVRLHGSPMLASPEAMSQALQMMRSSVPEDDNVGHKEHFSKSYIQEIDDLLAEIARGN